MFDFLHSLWLRLKTRRRPELPGKITGNDSGVEFTSEAGKVILITWNDVEKICAYKKDCYTIDQIRMEIYSVNPEVDILITEDTLGFDEFQKELLQHFPSISADWIGKIIQPPFATNLTFLYDRNKQI
jgi:hypothetical protein